MKKNQKYSKSNMFPVIESWQKSCLSQGKFCEENEYRISTFQYWLRKYRKEFPNIKRENKSSKLVKEFLPIEVSNTTEKPLYNDESFDIYYPNGVRLSCSTSINTEALRTLINL